MMRIHHPKINDKFETDSAAPYLCRRYMLVVAR